MAEARAAADRSPAGEVYMENDGWPPGEDDVQTKEIVY
jgi:hypothetical protein